MSDCIFKILQLWQSGFSRVYSNWYCRCSFEHEIIKIGQSTHKMYSNNIVNFQESSTIYNAHTKKVWKLIVCTSYMYSAGHVRQIFWKPLKPVTRPWCNSEICVVNGLIPLNEIVCVETIVVPVTKEIGSSHTAPCIFVKNAPVTSVRWNKVQISILDFPKVKHWGLS